MSSGESSKKNPHGISSHRSTSTAARGGATSSFPAPRHSKGSQYGSGTFNTVNNNSSSAVAATAAAARPTASSSGVPYTHRSTPTAVRSRCIGPLSWQGRQEPASAIANAAAAGANGDAAYGDGFEPDAEQGHNTVSCAAAEMIRLRRILDGDGAAVAAEGPNAGPPPTEQDSSCEVAAAGIIVACQDSGLCDVSMRGVTRLPPSLHKFFRAEGSLVSELQLQGNRLSTAPPLELLPSLTCLELSANLLSSVPDSLGKLKKLRALDLSRNVQVVALPDSLCDLSALTSLDVSHNSLQCLPLRMGQLNRLVEMRLDSNQLSYLPPECASLPNLTALHASYNRLTALPGELGGASSLTGIFVNHNKLTAIPATLGRLRQRLADLHLHNNELTVLPREIGLLAALTRITTSCNPLVHPPLAVARRGVAAVREYLLADWHDLDGQGDGDGVSGADGGVGGSEAAATAPEEPLGQEQEQGGAGGVGVIEPRGVASARRWRRLMLSVACKGCADKDDRIEELGQLLREARDRAERTERQLEYTQERIRRQAQDLTLQAQRSVQLDAEISRLNKQLTEAASMSPLLGRRPGGGGGGGYDRRAEELEEHLRKEVKEARSAAEAAGAAAEAAEREARRFRRDSERREHETATYRERAEELVLALARERERCNAAVAAATEATQQVAELQNAVKERDELRKKLEAVEKASHEAWTAAHAAREGHLSSEATADMVQGRLVAAEAANRRLMQQLQEEKATAARAAAEADSRQTQLQLELARVRADLAALMAERDVLYDSMRLQAPAADRAGETSTCATGTVPQAATASADRSLRNTWASPQKI